MWIMRGVIRPAIGCVPSTIITIIHFIAVPPQWRCGDSSGRSTSALARKPRGAAINGSEEQMFGRK
jgi:hypothetical protein